ncbi:hypothetical protein HUO09_16755 [Vibrio sp. Y2-5]|uniref:hypothetical protein n=1 Tax=Vibrio sp. Y2-5 TaxID=2743977 RepID=UPI0016614398|nr:hypothetical protein [Vibrio sp. Y2-5]MBD0788005.1 hypothetical protein [Vibrio sp. Y2-5]
MFRIFDVMVQGVLFFLARLLGLGVGALARQFGFSLGKYFGGKFIQPPEPKVKSDWELAEEMDRAAYKEAKAKKKAEKARRKGSVN